VVEEILAAGFIGQEPEGKAVAADEIAASCRQNFCAGHTGPQTHVELSVYNDICSSVEVICGSVTSVGACCPAREGSSSYAGICTQETRSFRSVMSTAKHCRARTATGREIARALFAVAVAIRATAAVTGGTPATPRARFAAVAPLVLS